MTARTLAPLAALAAAWLCLAVPANAAGDPADSPPVLLRQSLLLTPNETAGSGLAPEVKVRVTVDARGRVAKVEVLSIAPSSEYDDLFRKAVVETLGTWRYAPARKGGEPVETRLEWTIDFRPKQDERIGAVAPTRSPVRDRRSGIFLRSAQEQAKALDRLVGLAEEHLAPDHRQLAESQRFRVVSDAEEGGAAQIVDRDLEAAFQILDAMFGQDVEPQPARTKVQVYLFTRREDFLGLVSELGAPEWLDSGFYDPPGLLAFHLQAQWNDDLLAVAVHEAVHAYLDQHLVKPGSVVPPWFGEGLAEYFGNSEIKDGQLIPGRTRRGKYVLDQRYNGVERETTAAGWSLETIQRAVRRGPAISVETLLSEGPASFYHGPVALHYGLSWLLVHFLRHGEPGWETGAFPALVLYLAEGYPAEAALEAAYGKTAKKLERPFEKYVRSF